MDKILHQNQQKELTRNGLSHCEGHAIDSSEVGEDQVTLWYILWVNWINQNSRFN